MGYVIFTTPAVITVALYHAARLGSAPSLELVQSAARLTLALIICILSYRGAGLAWDDIMIVISTGPLLAPKADLSLPATFLSLVPCCIADSRSA